MTDNQGRFGHRRTVLLQARCRKSSLHVMSVELDDLSQGGCSIIGQPQAFVPGEVVQLRIAGIKPVEAIVRWSDEYRAGVEFKKPLSQPVLETLTKAYGIGHPG